MNKNNYFLYIICGISLLLALFLTVSFYLYNRNLKETLSDNFTSLDVSSFAGNNVQFASIKYLEKQLKEDICSLNMVESADIHINYQPENETYEVFADVTVQDSLTLHEDERQQMIQLFLSAMKNLSEEDIFLNIVE